MRRRNLLARIFAAAGVAVISIPPPAHAADATAGPTIVLIVENDSFVHRLDDRHYTSGIYLSWTSKTLETANSYDAIADYLSIFPRDASAKYRNGFFFGQNIFTPENLSRIVPSLNDRPYAGWLYLGARLYRESDKSLDRFETKIGVIGPWSFAKDLQTWIHALHWFGGEHPNGWASQLHNEPGLVLSEQRIWRRTSPKIGPLETEVLPEVNISIGNVFTYAGAGVSLRFGEHLDADWGPPRIEPGLAGSDFVNFDKAPLAWYGFIGFEQRVIARNIFLDGNSFRDSANIAKEPLVGDVHMGFAVLWRRMSLYLTYTLRGREFKAQRRDDQFLAITTSYLY